MPIVLEFGWAPGPVWRGGGENIIPTGIRSLNRSDLSESLTDYAIPSPYWRFEIYFIDSEGRRYICEHLPSCSCQHISQNIHFQHRAAWMPSVNKRLVSVFLVTSHYLRYRWQSCRSSYEYYVQINKLRTERNKRKKERRKERKKEIKTFF